MLTEAPIDVSPEMDVHLRQVVRALQDGRLVFFLGAGANLCDRREGWTWNRVQRESLPNGSELATYLAETFHLEPTGDLAKVAQHVELQEESGPLYDTLQSLFDADWPITSLHRLLAGIPAILRAKKYPHTQDSLRRRLLFVTTNFDDLLERALGAAGESFHLVVYQAEGEHKGRFLHQAPAGDVTVVESANDYRGLFADEHPIVLKIHGGVNRTGISHGSFVITEDHYIEYLVRKESVANLLPAPIPSLLTDRNLLFLGYALRDWNLRVILYRLWEDSKLAWKSWAIQRSTDPMEMRFWKKRAVEILPFSLGDYVPLLAERLRELPSAEVKPT
jgi:SIR2-like protein